MAVLGFIVGLSGAMLPGPMSAYAISIALRRKSTHVLLIVVGHIFVEAVMVVLLLLGLRQILGSKILFNIFAILGGGGIILMGLLIFLRSGKATLSMDTKINFSSGLILSGMFLTAFNPTFPAWWLSIGVGLLSRALMLGLAGVIVFVLGHWLSDLAWFSLLGFVVNRGKAWLNERRYQLMLKILGLILFGFGLWFICQVNQC